jgi:sulfide:quinone oxidoreductase
VRLDGEWLAADALVVALGAEQAPHAVPGLAEHGINVWDRANAGRAHDALASLDRGRLLVGVFGTPYACPPGPFELALLARDVLAARGADVSVEVFGPMPIALPVVGPVESGKVEALLEAAGVPFHRGQPATSVEAGVVHLADGRDLAFDLLLAVPPHRCPQVLVDAGLAQAGGWVEVDPRTLATSFEGVYAIGDATAIKLAHGLPLPKAGLFAEAEGNVVAERVAAELAGRPATATFDGTGVCFAETGGGQAVEINARFYADPPAADILGPSDGAMAGKAAFEADRLAAWFGR